ncbi:XrtN system VIT domain-containing protein [Parachryseolinea silvisoli]|uniref:XrtN system VIT domain-containing protein n=1 Tax=Parachryseolinea silvisoli TaxID=2873601 RepID=UPI002265D70A|nr:XrtN system VIT domain-containing protein [Parachryseolinea silvisoli]MCD9016328.1 XrtN system VIT domain-containing protein [Parachryseolinea silvisoli]
MITLDETKKAAPVSETREVVKPDKILLTGYFLLAASTLLFCILAYSGQEVLHNMEFPAFVVHYSIALGYMTTLIVHRAYGIRRSWLRENIDRTIVLLNLFLVSAYALNRSVPVFEDSASWLCVYLVVSSLVTLSYRYYDFVPPAINKIQHFLLGATFVLYTYLALYIGLVYFPATFGILVLGVGLLAFVPIFLLIASATLIRYTKKTNRVSTNWIVAGVATTVTFALIFIIEWDARVRTIERLANQSVIYADTELPVWVKISQSIKLDWVSDRILKSDFTYTTPDDRVGEFNFLGRSSSQDVRTHDPLVYLAMFWRKPSLSHEDREKILQAITDNRHRTQERLWRGDNLTTSYTVTDVDIYPQLRLAYTEQYMNIRNNNNPGWWGSRQEAIYTFQLPEGSVVTSLSLWVNGKEEKAVLTSKQKATEAYTTIVGKEARDPSVVHWQEGNTVTVRVFPCTREEERKFKIGITSPLPEENGRIVYRQATFRGPNAHDANETFRFRFIGSLGDATIPHGFEENEKGEYIAERSYDPDFAISWKAVPIENNQYTFNGSTYSLKPYTPVSKPLHLSYLFLDINNTWEAAEVDAAYAVLTKCNVYAFFDNEFIRLHEDNWYEVTNKLRQRNFSLFPFHHVKDTEHSLVVTKGRPLTPYLTDIKESTFAESVSRYFAANKKVNVFNLVGGTSTYIRSLRELRAFNFATGDVDALADLLEHNQFPIPAEDENHIILYDAGMVLERKPASAGATDTAPDHLVRLFAYNNIMRQVGVHFFSDDFINETLVNEAALAYVVSPVSSLIVLETQKDYDRFGIKDIANSLGNATHNESGAVPEPHEWALIAVFLCFVLFNVVRRYRLKSVTAPRV